MLFESWNLIFKMCICNFWSQFWIYTVAKVNCKLVMMFFKEQFFWGDRENSFVNDLCCNFFFQFVFEALSIAKMQIYKAIFACHTTPGKNFLFRNGNAHQNGRRHENCCIKSTSQLRGEHCESLSNFFPSECPGLCST